jgi:hypothetical protein
MGARQKLNGAYFNGAVILALIAGAVTGSPVVGALAFAGLMAAALASGDIRPGRRRQP